MPEGIIESITVRRRSEEASRLFLVMSFSVRDAGHLLPLFAQQLKNTCDVQFGRFQLPLPEGEVVEDAPYHPFMPGGDRTENCDFCGAIESAAIHHHQAEMVQMQIDGETAGVVREPLSEAAQALIDGAREDGQVAPHAFEASEANNQCALCHLGEEHLIHHAMEGEAVEARAALASRSRNR